MIWVRTRPHRYIEIGRRNDRRSSRRRSINDGWCGPRQRALSVEGCALDVPVAVVDSVVTFKGTPAALARRANSWALVNSQVVELSHVRGSRRKHRARLPERAHVSVSVDEDVLKVLRAHMDAVLELVDRQDDHGCPARALHHSQGLRPILFVVEARLGAGPRAGVGDV